MASTKKDRYAGVQKMADKLDDAVTKAQDALVACENLCWDIEDQIEALRTEDKNV